MNTRSYKNTNTEVSLLGLGCMRFPTIEPGKDPIDKQKAQEIVDYAYSNGVNYFDTAYIYHGGLSEEFIGEALKKYPRESYFLADKLPGWLIKNADDAERIFNEQLKRCGVDYFDFYLCHALGDDAFKVYDKFDIMSFLLEKRKQGVIKRLGFSFHDTPEALERIISRYDWDFVQIQLNYLDWDLYRAKEQYDVIVKHGLQAVIMEPVRGGALATLCDEACDVLKTAEPQRSVASWAIRYAASLPGVLTVLSGMSNKEQVVDNVNTLTDFRPLSDQQRETLNSALTIYKDKLTIPCTGCRYCMECPSGVEIPAIFKMYNRYCMGKNVDELKENYAALGDEKQIKNCISCGQCASHCPQGLKIPELLHKIEAEIAELGE